MLHAALLLAMLLAMLLASPAFAGELAEALAGEKPAAESTNKTTLGWLQSIRLQPYRKRLTAKLDTGAKSSVIHALDIQPVRINGKDHVRFTVPVANKKSAGVEEIMFELPVVRKLRIKQHDGLLADERIVVELDFCLNYQAYTTEFSLDNRQRFNYPILLGRNFLHGKFIVDPEHKFLHRSYCP